MIAMKVSLSLIITRRKILDLEDELRIVGNNMKSLEISEQEVMLAYHPLGQPSYFFCNKLLETLISVMCLGGTTGRGL